MPLALLAMGASLGVAQSPNPILPSLGYKQGMAQWQSQPGYLYRVERSTVLGPWIRTPEQHYGLGQIITQPLHQDFNPEVTPGVVLQPRAVAPPAVQPPAILSRFPQHPPGGAQVTVGIEALLTQVQAAQVDGNPRVVDVILSVQLRNKGTQDLPNVQVIAPLSQAFRDLLQLQPPTSIQIMGAPVVQVDGTGQNFAADVNSAFDGSTDQRLLLGTRTLPAGILGSTNSPLILSFTVRCTFPATWLVPRSYRYLFVMASGGTSSSNSGGVFNADVTSYTPASGATAFEISSNRYFWHPLGPANPVSPTSFGFYQTAEIFTRTFQVVAFSDGCLLIWWSPTEKALVREWFGGLNLSKPAGGYYKGFVSLNKIYPAPAPYVPHPPDFSTPTFGCETRVQFHFLAHGSYNNQPATAAQKASHAPASESITTRALIPQFAEILQRYVAQAAPATPSLPPAGSLDNSDHDSRVKSREFYRVCRLSIDTNCNGIYDSEEMQTSEEWMNLEFTAQGVIKPLADYAAASGKTVLINEICPQNDGNFLTGPLANQKFDWVELYNASESTVDLTGWKLKDSGNITFTFVANGPVSNGVPPGGYKILLCGAPNGTTGYQAVPFTLTNGGENVTLLRPDDSTADAALHSPTSSPDYVANYLGVLRDKTFGRYLDPLHAQNANSVVWGHLAYPTPGGANALGFVAAKLPDPVFYLRNPNTYASLNPGLYSRQEHPILEMFLPTLPTAGTFHYTTNGAVPTAWSAVYDPANPPRFDRSVIIRAVLIAEGRESSRVVTKSYLFKESILGAASGDPALLSGAPPLMAQLKPDSYPEWSLPEAGLGLPNGVQIPYGVSSVVNSAANRSALMEALSDLPSLSIVCPVDEFFNRDTAGIYACSNNTSTAYIDPEQNEWERTCSFEWFQPENGPTSAENVDCALSISGNTNLSWYRTEKHSLTLSFKSAIGPGKYDPQIYIFPEANVLPNTIR